MKEKIHSVKYNFVMNFILTASQFIFPLITFPYISRVLQASGNGKVSLAYSVANYFMIVASLGIPTYGVRACASVRNDKEKLTKTVHEIFIINCIATVIVAATYILCVCCIQRFHNDKILFYINGIQILLNVIGMNWLFQALEQYDYITFRSIFFKIVSVILMFIFVKNKDDCIEYTAILVFAAAGSNVLNFIRARKIIKFRYIGNYEFRIHLKPILILFAQSMAVSIYTNLDTVMLGFIKTDKDVGYYNAAVKIKTVLLSLVTSLGNVLLPRMSYYAQNGLRDNFLNMMTKALNFTLLISIPLSTYFVVYSKEAMLFIAGDEYIKAVTAMQIITLAIIPNGLTGVLGVQILTALGKEKYVLYSVITGAISDFLLNLIFISRYGAAGAAFATTVAEFLVLAVQICYTRDILKKVSQRFHIGIYILATIVGVACSLMVRFFDIKSYFGTLVISSGIFFVMYAFVPIISRESLFAEMLGGIKRKTGKEEKYD